MQRQTDYQGQRRAEKMQFVSGAPALSGFSLCHGLLQESNPALSVACRAIVFLRSKRSFDKHCFGKRICLGSVINGLMAVIALVRLEESRSTGQHLKTMLRACLFWLVCVCQPIQKSMRRKRMGWLVNEFNNQAPGIRDRLLTLR